MIIAFNANVEVMVMIVTQGEGRDESDNGIRPDREKDPTRPLWRMLQKAKLVSEEREENRYGLLMTKRITH